MCLAIPGEVIDIEKGTTPAMGTVSFGGVGKHVCLQWLPDVSVGDYVIVHVGFAISKMNEEEARETLKLISQLDDALGERGSEGKEADV